MKKIPTLFERVYENHKIVGIRDNITPGCEEAFNQGAATIKYDGSCCAVKNGIFYKRFDAKKGRKIPDGAIPCCDPDPTTGHWPHWVMLNKDKPEDKWFWKAFENTAIVENDATYEAVGPHFQGNPYDLEFDILVRHGTSNCAVLERTFESVKEYLRTHEIEGLVFWLYGEPILDSIGL